MSTVLKNHSGGSSTASQWDCSDRVHSDQIILWTVRWEAGPRERLPKVLKTKPTQGRPSGSSPLRSDGSHDGQARGWTSWEAADDNKRESWKTTLESQGTQSKNWQSDSLTKVQLTLSQGEKKGDEVADDEDNNTVISNVWQQHCVLREELFLSTCYI